MKPTKMDIALKQELRNLLLIEVADLLVEELGGRGICLSASWLISGILNSYGKMLNYWDLKCKHYFVSIIAVNEAGVNMLKQQSLPVYNLGRKGKIPLMLMNEILVGIRKKLKKKYYSVGILWDLGESEKENIYEGNFHSIIKFQDGTIMDLTADQMNRPQHNLIMKRYWLKRNKLPKPYVYFKIEKQTELAGGIGLSPNLIPVMNQIAEMIAETLNCKKFKIQDQRSTIYNNQEWDKRIKKVNQMIKNGNKFVKKIKKENEEFEKGSES